MGGLCSRRSTEDGTTNTGFPHVNGHFNYGSGIVYQSRGVVANLNSILTPPLVGETMDKQLGESFSLPEVNTISYGMNVDDINDGSPRLSRALSDKSKATKSKQAVAKVCPAWILFLDMFLCFYLPLHFLAYIFNYIFWKFVSKK
ncbi:hypothetical protein CsSME_00015320 [Camellia sinensis var. sinensis]